MDGRKFDSERWDTGRWIETSDSASESIEKRIPHENENDVWA